jgi:hypothetical protein
VASELVAQKRKKKKRKQAAPAGEDEAPASESPKKRKKLEQGDEAVKSDPNEVSILDMPSTSEPAVKRAKRAKKSKSQGFQPSDFKPARAPKSSAKGNKSMTFS